MDTQLNFINESNDANNSQIVVFSKNVSTGYGEHDVAWLVIRNCAQGDNHPFVYPERSQGGISDSYGNYTPKLDAQPGQVFTLSLTSSGHTLAHSGNANHPTEIQIENGLPQGTMNAHIFKDGELFATKTSVAPQQMAAFQFEPTIWIGAVSQVMQGQVMNSAIVDTVHTELSLLGIASADIVMTGGGPCKVSQPFTFTLQNIVMA